MAGDLINRAYVMEPLKNPTEGVLNASTWPEGGTPQTLQGQKLLYSMDRPYQIVPYYLFIRLFVCVLYNERAIVSKVFP